MDIREGLFDGMVLQRTPAGVCDVVVTGRCTAGGIVRVRVTARGKVLKGLANVRVGRAAGGRFTARIRGIPVGGPYAVTLSIADGKGEARDSAEVRDVYVGDVWLLGGQSNMQGVGILADRLPPRKEVRAFYMNDRWAPAEDPIHNLWEAVDPVHGATGAPASPPITGVGPGVAFGQDMLAATGVPQGLIACAHGGTSMSQWDPKLKKLGGKSLYGAMVRRFKKNGSRVAGVVWYQGCSDASPEAAAVYTRRMKALIRAMRRDFGDKRLPVVLVQIARVVGRDGFSAAAWNSIQDQQRRLPEVIDRVATVPAIDLELDDLIHISGKSQHVLGRRLAQAMRVLIQGRKAGKPPIALKSVSTLKDPAGRAMDCVVVEFENVEGRLLAPGRATGFALGDPTPFSCILRTDLAGSRAILHTTMQEADLAPLQVYYGYGCDPYCNITDAAGRSLPVFGPVAVGTPRALTPFVQEILVSDFLPAEPKLAGLAAPPPGSIALRPMKFATRFCDRHLEIGATAGRDGVYYFLCRFECPQRMKLQALFGYDGPAKVWIDGREVFYDPDGTNPATPTDAAIPFTASEGAHELLVALGNNRGKAWGIFLRFERLGVRPAVLRKGPESYAMPRFLPVGG
jgi:sialate O-acetylesterase